MVHVPLCCSKWCTRKQVPAKNGLGWCMEWMQINNWMYIIHIYATFSLYNAKSAHISVCVRCPWAMVCSVAEAFYAFLSYLYYANSNAYFLIIVSVHADTQVYVECSKPPGPFSYQPSFLKIPLLFFPLPVALWIEQRHHSTGNSSALHPRSPPPWHLPH